MYRLSSSNSIRKGLAVRFALRAMRAFETANFFMMKDAFSWEMGRPYFRFLRETVYST
jgi:hypothetical protein